MSHSSKELPLSTHVSPILKDTSSGKETGSKCSTNLMNWATASKETFSKITS